MHTCHYTEEVKGNVVVRHCMGCGDYYEKHLYNLGGIVEDFDDEVSVEKLDKKVFLMKQKLQELEKLLELAKKSFNPATKEEVEEYLED